MLVCGGVVQFGIAALCWELLLLLLLVVVCVT
jgi:hypothetical protein